MFFGAFSLSNSTNLVLSHLQLAPLSDLCDLCALRGALEVISRFTAFHCLHCPLSGGPEAHTLTSSEARRATLTVVATLRAQRGPTLSLQVKPMAHTQSGSVATVCSVVQQRKQRRSADRGSRGGATGYSGEART